VEAFGGSRGLIVFDGLPQRGVPVAPMSPMLPHPPALPCGQDKVSLAEIDQAAEAAFQDDMPADELHRARVHVAERWLVEALVALEDAEWRGDIPSAQERFGETYSQALRVYQRLMRPTPEP
jgi:hypothetical protein